MILLRTDEFDKKLRLGFPFLDWKGFVMIHYTCDRCKHEISTADQLRYVVQVDVRPVIDQSYAEFSDEVDHLSELNDMLESTDSDLIGEDAATCHRGRYDLCPECYQQFLKNPLGRDIGFALGFSNN